MSAERNIPLTNPLSKTSQIAYGCMGLGGGWNNNPVTNEHVQQANEVIDTALESGITVFDHADIYTFNKAEIAFGSVLKQTPSLRDDMFIQSKCGIRFKDESAPGRYDFSSEWITHSVNGILKRLHTEKLDMLLLHRPDPLMGLHDLAASLERLNAAGKFDYLGVSNMNLHQIRFLQSALDLPIVANQIEMSLAKLDWLNDGVLVGNEGMQNVDFVSGTLEHCQMNNIQIQAWGCLAQGRYSEVGLHSEDANIRNTAQLVLNLSEKHQVPSEAIVLAFLLRHPANIQPVIGTTNLDRIRASALATTVTLSREEWYRLFVTSRGHALP